MAAEQHSIQASQLGKSYPIFSSPSSRLRHLLVGSYGSGTTQFWALRNVSFHVDRGETFCIVGQNGSGKSTLLQIIASIFPPTEGTLHVHGRIAALLELGAGFNPDFTGRENVSLNAALLGFSRAELHSLLPAIEAFAEIGHFLDQPVKTYSSGMLVRLAFAVAVHVNPDILIVDEALAVGDIYFRQRCMRKVHQLKRTGTTIIYVTHSAADVRAIADTCLWLDAGQVRECGDPESVISHYLAEMTTRDGRYQHAHPDLASANADAIDSPAPEIIRGLPNCDHRYGDRRAEILGMAITSPAGEPLSLLRPHSEVVLRLSITAHQAIASPVVGYVMRNHLGIDLAVSNNLREGFALPPLRPGQVITVDFHLSLPELYPSSFSFSGAIADGALDSFVMCDWVENVLCMEMDRGAMPVYGYVHLPCRIAVNQQLRSNVAREVTHA